jgi:hypothetical protein
MHREVGTKLSQEIGQRGLPSAGSTLQITSLNRVLPSIKLLSLYLVRLEHLLECDLGPHL